MRGRLAFAIVGLALAVAGCGGTEACPKPADLAGEPERSPPADVSVPDYAHVYKSEGTDRFYAVLDGTPAELPSRRDDVQNALILNSGYASLSTDEKEGAEAVAHLKGPERTVDIQVTPLCAGKLQVRYTVR